jgi:glycine/D-amino acid oxidase-like deaminating enzyme
MDSTTDVLIIGGGILGCATAYYLASRGLDVLLVERGPLNREASGTSMALAAGSTSRRAVG